jgi:hypothetical protein
MSNPNEPLSGSIPYTIGMPAIMRIPIPGTNGLCIELRPRGRFIPKGGSTSAIFFQDITGRRQLRLDYGFNKQTKTFDYHWNQTGVHAKFSIENHTPAGSVGAALYKAAKYYRYAGRAFVILGVVDDVVSIVRATSPMRRSSEVVSAWAFAWAGCRAVGAVGAEVGALASPVGIAIGGVGGCIIGGFAGYQIGLGVGGTVYDWGQSVFISLPQTSPP